MSHRYPAPPMGRRSPGKRMRYAGNALLQPAEVARIKRLLAEGAHTQRQLAELLNVSYNCINSIANGRAWSWIAPEVLGPDGQPLPLVDTLDTLEPAPGAAPPTAGGFTSDYTAADSARRLAPHVQPITWRLLWSMPPEARQRLLATGLPAHWAEPPAPGQEESLPGAAAPEAAPAAPQPVSERAKRYGA